MDGVKKKFIIILVLLFLIIGIGGLYFLLPDKEKTITSPIEKEEIIENEEVQETISKRYLDNKAINDDYEGFLYFDSGIINVPIVKAKGELSDYTFYAFNNGVAVKNYKSGCEGGSCNLNDVYLRKDWLSGKYELGGSIFMDYRNTIYDQNIIIYGHMYSSSMDKNREMMFSPLEKLLIEDNYKDNSKLYLELASETRTYQVAYVYLFNKTNDDYNTLQYYRTNYEYDFYGEHDEGYFDKYINKLEEVKIYDTGINLTSDDNTLTLQTCYNNDDNYVQIVVCKEIQ